MTRACFYHPDQEAVATCAQCGMPIGEECREIVGDKTVCKRCVGTIRARVEQDLARSPVPALAGVRPAGAIPVGQTLTQKPPGAHLLLGIGLGVLVSLFGAVLLDKFTFYTHLGLGYINAMVGFAIGYAVLFGGKQGGLVPGIIGGALALVASLLGYYFLMMDVIALQNLHYTASQLLSEYPDFLQHRTVMSWVLVAIGVYGGFKTPYQAAFRAR